MNFDFANPNLLWLLLLLPVLALLRSASGKSGSIIFSSVAIAKEAAGKNRAKPGILEVFINSYSARPAYYGPRAPAPRQGIQRGAKKAA